MFSYKKMNFFVLPIICGLLAFWVFTFLKSGFNHNFLKPYKSVSKIFDTNTDHLIDTDSNHQISLKDQNHNADQDYIHDINQDQKQVKNSNPILRQASIQEQELKIKELKKAQKTIQKKLEQLDFPEVLNKMNVDSASRSEVIYLAKEQQKLKSEILKLELHRIESENQL